MEDAHINVLDLAAGADLDEKIHPSSLSFFGVFDGHGGEKVALFTGDNIHNIILKQESFQGGDYAQGLKDGFLATDRAILNGMTSDAVLPLTAKKLTCSRLLCQIRSTRRKSQVVQHVSG